MDSMKLFKIILPAIICLFFSLYIEDLDLYPMFFAIIIGLLNFNKAQNILYVFLYIFLSYCSYLAGIITFIGLNEIFDYILINKSDIISIIISVFVIAPIFLVFSSIFIFKIRANIGFTFTITISFIVFLVIYYLLTNKVGDNFLNNNFIVLNVKKMWLIIMALLVQLIINQRELVNKNN